MSFFGTSRQLDRIERKLDEHIARHNGHPTRTYKGLSFYQWLIAILIASVVGADLIVDILSGVSKGGL